MRVVVITKIFPSSLEPLSAPFNLRQIAELAKRCDVEVLEAIPHVPLAQAFSVPARAARLSALPARELVHGVDVTYVRQLYVPRVGLAVAVPLYLASLLPHRERLRAADVLLATWAYPDGCATVLAARACGKPCVVKVHGSDVNVVLQTSAARALAARVLPLADAVVAVSRPLAEELVELGVPRERVHLVMNGIDASVFRPRDRAAARRALGVADDARVVLFVGRLEPQKGIHELLDAFERMRARVPRATLALVGQGISSDEVRARVARWEHGAAILLGARPPAEVAEWMGACDVMTLPSWAEGTPNVVLEALASGRPVVATGVGGIPDVLRDARSGIVVPPRDAGALASALGDALERQWDEAAVHASAPGSWRESAEGLASVLEHALAAHARSQRLARLPRPPRHVTGGAVPATPRPTSSRSSAPSLLFASTWLSAVSRSIASRPRSRSRSR
jgi:glycosyltransferase involved in cell wall biosynthesis